MIEAPEREVALSDDEIDQIIGTLLEDREPLRPAPRPGGWTGLWCLGVFLLGMTVMEGLQRALPPQGQGRGEVVRCGEAATRPHVAPVGPGGRILRDPAP